MVSLDNPEASALVSTYRSLVPVRARRKIVRRVPQPLRNAVMAALALADAVRTATVVWMLGGRRKPARHSAAALLKVVKVGGRHARATLVPGATAWAARARNLHIVVAALEAADIDYFCVRGVSGPLPCVAVPSGSRGDVEEVLRLVFGRNPGYVGTSAARMHPGASAKTWRRLTSTKVLRLAWYVCDPTGELVFGAESGCDLEFWTESDGRLVAPRPNRVVTEVPAARETGWAPQTLFSTVPPAYTTGYARTLPEFAAPLPEDHLFPIDVVYTWVDGDDPKWRAVRDAVRDGKTEADAPPLHEQAANDSRYTSRDELLFSLRALHQYAPWVRRIHLVTAGQVPRWLNTDHPGLRVVDHREIFSDPDALPTFNSHAIESQLHHIPNLAEHFLYLNDDVFFGRPVRPGQFFHPNGLTKFFMSKALIPSGSAGPDDLPVNAAGKNSRGLIAQQFGTVISQKMKHTPHALRRSVLDEIEQVYAQAHRVTQHSRFRSPHDVPIASSLHHYYAYHSARATVGDIRYVYIDLADKLAQRRLNSLLAKRDFDTFCINDTVVADDPDAQARMIDTFLNTYFPVPSPYEQAGADALEAPRTGGLGLSA
ncbi:stealth family protein [Streptomyces pristinaespiralis]|uniref:Exopolysaccharide phosphotransferase n=2 Tax=Streptomyces pristinaespiralis TaxID=38300 RepID=B5HCJ4_STRE2|nr:exopolysaccharide phosphotransferase [Streptomyces pristinaespiralis ATCC 25486]QMU16989.1 stealth family protein [Streptomyces pristinaespiralis]